MKFHLCAREFDLEFPTFSLHKNGQILSQSGISASQMEEQTKELNAFSRFSTLPQTGGVLIDRLPKTTLPEEG
jgi:hypothetical protein